jgi:hypothetical protein
MQCEMPRALVEPTRRASSAEPPAMVAASMISMSRWRESSLSCSSRSNMTMPMARTTGSRVARPSAEAHSAGCVALRMPQRALHALLDPGWCRGPP